jgi:flagellar protein FlbD
MIKLTRLNGSEIVVNSELIEHVELTADTVVILTNGTSFVVKESSEQIVEKIIEFKRQVFGITWALKADRQMA